MRIIGGMWKGRKIQSCPGGYRPTSGIIKKSLFDILGVDVEESRFLDLFAGAGAVGIEAMSRGASHVCFVENEFSRIRTLHYNLLVGLGVDKELYRIAPSDFAHVLGDLRDGGEKFDIIYVDPPYEGMVPGRILGDIAVANILDEDGLIIYEAARKDVREILETAPGELYPLKERVHGGTALIFFRWRKMEDQHNLRRTLNHRGM